MTRVRDPIHNYIHLDPMGRELADAPRLQRLRRIHQLGTGGLVYPGANHMRFEHSLGSYHLAGLASMALGISDEQRRSIQAAALLHDVGHGPFSHTCDALYRDHLGKTHEEVSIEAVQKGALADILAKHDVDPSGVAALIRGEGPLGGLVSGDLDVDRMDYLVRDAHYTGVSVSVDLARLVQDLVMTPQGVAIRESSLTAAEALLVTRLQMYASVYFHKTLRIAERMIERAFRLALEAGEIKPEQLTQMDDAAATMLLRHSKTDAWRWILAVDQRKLYKVAIERRASEHPAEAIARLAQSTEAQQTLEARIAQALGIRASEVIVDVPDLPTLPETNALVVRDDGVIEDLAHASSLVRALPDAQRDHWRLRVIVPASRREDARAKAGKLLEDALGADNP